MNGVLVVDKPPGPTSHDVVARVRRALRERAHRPHRHARSARDRRAAARRRPRHAPRAVPASATTRSTTPTSASGVATDTYDADGCSIRRRAPERGRACRRVGASTRALDAFRGTFLQTPPAYLGEEDRRRPRVRAGARADGAVELKPVAGDGPRARRCSRLGTSRRACGVRVLSRLLRPVAGARPRRSGSGCGAHLRGAAADAGGRLLAGRRGAARRRSSARRGARPRAADAARAAAAGHSVGRADGARACAARSHGNDVAAADRRTSRSCHRRLVFGCSIASRAAGGDRRDCEPGGLLHPVIVLM